MEPLIRESIERAATSGDLPWTEAEAVGGWWNRQFNPEVDLVGADRAPVASRIYFAGSIKWIGTPFDKHDLAELERAAGQVPGFESGDAALLIVSLSGVSRGLKLRATDQLWRANDVLAAWRTN